MNADTDEARSYEKLLLIGIGLILCFRYEYAAHTFWHLHKVKIEFFSAFAIFGALVSTAAYFRNRHIDKAYDQAITQEEKNAVLLGDDPTGETHFLKQAFRTTHAQVIGTTSAGKTESVILPWAIHDIENGSGLLIIDGKSDRSFLEKLYGYVASADRTCDFRLFSLADIDSSSTFNPLANGSPQEVAERVFSSFKFENEYYKNIQFKIFLSLIRLIQSKEGVATFALVHRLLTDMELLAEWLSGCKDQDLVRELLLYTKLSEKDRMEKVSGLDASLTHFSCGATGILFNSEKPQIDLGEALKKNQILYFQLPTMYYPFLASVTGKLVLQSLQNEVAKRHLGISGKPKFFTCFLDDFQDYIFKEFGSLLNKSRSANVGVVFSHQALGDLDSVDAAFRNVVLTNTNVKIVMRNNNPETCEYFSSSFGTKRAQKTTERQTQKFLGATKTGEGSVREVEEYIFHPNEIRQLGVGVGIVSIPHAKGVKFLKIKFKRREDILGVSLPIIKKEPYVPKAQSSIPKANTDYEVV